MHHGIETAAGWLINGFEATVGFWVWMALVLLYALYRSVAQPEPDAIRPSGPVQP